MSRFVFFILLLAAACVAGAQAPSLDDVRRLVREDRLDDALSAIEARLDADPADRQTRFLKGVVLAERQQVDAAIDVFTSLTRDYPDLPEPYNNLAVLYASRGDFEAARDALLNAINTHPSYATAHENLGDIYAKMAGLAYSRALSLDTANVVAKQKLALIDDLFTRDPQPPLMVAARGAPAPAPVPAQRAAPAPQPAPAPPAAAPPAPPAPAVSRPPPTLAAAEPARVAPPVDPVAEGAGVIEAIQSWAAAWSAQDVDAYLGHYVGGASPEAGTSRTEWERVRRLRLTRPEFIDVAVDNFQVMNAGADRVEVSFIQVYRSNTYGDRVRKSLTLLRTDQGWKISQERTIAKL